jgi:hypothetical protein
MDKSDHDFQFTRLLIDLPLETLHLGFETLCPVTASV